VVRAPRRADARPDIDPLLSPSGVAGSLGEVLFFYREMVIRFVGVAIRGTLELIALSP
jgi:hypothetical protein